MSETQNEAPEVPKESKVFMVDGQLQDAWGRPAEEDEAVDMRESQYMSQTVPQLKAELRGRQDAGREFDTSSIKTKRDLVAALEADDKRQIQEAKEAGEDDQEDE